MIRRPRDFRRFVLGLLFLVPGVLVLLLGRYDVIALSWSAAGAVNVVASFFMSPRKPGGPGPLDATPTGRFRATGWPPSKDPEEYR